MINKKRPSKWRRLWLVLLLALLTTRVLAGGSYGLDWWTVDGGGGQSAAGNLAIAGTIAQPDGGDLSGGPFVLHGGYWGRPAGPTTFYVYLPAVKNGPAP